MYWLARRKENTPDGLWDTYLLFSGKPLCVVNEETDEVFFHEDMERVHLLKGSFLPDEFEKATNIRLNPGELRRIKLIRIELE
jgi:hypothetical protein